MLFRSDNQKSALTIYIHFLAEMFKEFTYEELVSDGLITPTRIRKPKIEGGVPLTPAMFKKGIVGLLRKCKAVLSSDSETVTIPLDMFHKLVEDAVQLHGGKMVSDIYKATSFMTESAIKPNTDWELAFTEDMRIETKNGGVYIGEEVNKIIFNPEQSNLIICSSESALFEQPLACMAVTRSSRTRLGVRVMEQAPLDQQIQLLKELRNVCYKIKAIIAPYAKLQQRKLSRVEYNDWLPTVLDSIQMPVLLESAANALYLMKEYGKMFRISLVTE